MQGMSKEPAMKSFFTFLQMMRIIVCAWAMAGAAVADTASDWSAKLGDLSVRSGEARVQSFELAVLSPDQREHMRQQMREHWQQLPPEQRQNQRREQRERWQQMPPEERQRAKDEWRQQRQQLEGGYDGQPQRGRGRP